MRPSNLHKNPAKTNGFRLSTLAIALATLSTATLAEDLPNATIFLAAAKATTLPPIVVNGKDEAPTEGYAAKRSSSALKSDTPLLDTPQSIAVVTQEQMRDFNVQSVADVVRYVPGVGMANGEGNRDSPYFRGVTSASGDFYLDGIRDDVEYYRDLYNIDRVEVLTGPNAMIFGRAGSGGIINRIAKRADWSEVRELRATVGSYRNQRLTADFAQRIDDTIAVRATAVAEDSRGYQKNAFIRRSGVNPSIAFRLGERTYLTLDLEHFQDHRAADRGVPSYKGAPLDLPVSAFFGDPDPATRPVLLNVDSAGVLFEHDFGGGVTLRNSTRYLDYDKSYQNYNAGAVNAAGTTVAMSAYNNHQWRQNLFNQTDFNFSLETGAVKHKFLAGMELGRQDTDYLRKSGRFPTFGNATTITLPLATAEGPLPVNFVLGATASDRDGHSKASVAAIYLQDQIEFTPQFLAVAGVRHDSFTLDYHNNVDGSKLGSRDSLTSPRTGLIFKPVPQVSLYTNYSVAYYPRGGDQLSSLTAVNQAFGPEKFVNLEAGAKWDISPSLSARAAVYQLARSNVAIADPVNAGQFLLVDGQRSKGVELALSGNITRDWSLIGGYAHQSAKLTATASATALSGASVALVPANLISLWNRYAFGPRWAVGLGLIHSGAVFTSTSNTVTLPAYTRVDGAVFFNVDKQLQLQLNVENLANKKYWVSANGDNNITPGTPRSVKLTATWRF